VPYGGADGTGLGKPLKVMLSASPTIAILLAGIGPRSAALAREIADGLVLPFLSPKGGALSAMPCGLA
jgi:alkanesulfonate monooxygenase SsuD/methylene tetrahydromethanopterin reductase-like flavin-dependent oxidoreductase (luciferase family)